MFCFKKRYHDLLRLHEYSGLPPEFIYLIMCGIVNGGIENPETPSSLSASKVHSPLKGPAQEGAD